MTTFTIHWGSMFIGVCIGCFATIIGLMIKQEEAGDGSST